MTNITSLWSWEELQEKLPKLDGAVWSQIRQTPFRTRKEIVRLMGREHNTITGAVKRLIDGAYVIEDGIRRCTITGRLANKVRPTTPQERERILANAPVKVKCEHCNGKGWRDER